MAPLTWRRCWLLAHRWLGLTLGLLLLVAALTGSLLILAEPLDRALHRHLFVAQHDAAGALEPVLQQLRAEFGPQAAFTLRPPREPGETLHAMVRGASWQGTVYFEPATARELGRRGHSEGFFNLLFELHSNLLAQDRGKAVLAAAALTYLVMLLSGVLLWWPARWRHAWTVKLRSGLSRTLFDLHRVVGAVMGVLVLVAVASGAYMAWRPLSAWVTQLSGRPPVTAPAPSAAPRGPALNLDAVVAQARERLPEGRVGYVQVPPVGPAPIRVRLQLPDDPHPNGLSSVWMQPDGQVVAVHRWSELDPGTRAYSYIYPLHIGTLGGMPMLLATLLAGMALAGFGVTGLWLWWRRRHALR